MSSPSIPTAERLKNIVQAADRIVQISPPDDVSAVRRLVGLVSQSASSLARVIAATPHSVSSMHVARFTTAAEDALAGLEQLCLLYGENPDASDIETEAEQDLDNVVTGLAAFAKTVRFEAVQRLRSNMQTTLEVLPAWNAPLEKKPETPAVVKTQIRGGAGELASTFLSAQPNLPAQIETKGVMSRLLGKKSAPAPFLEVPLKDAEAGQIFNADIDIPWIKIHNLSLFPRWEKIHAKNRSDVEVLTHPALVSAGLRVEIHEYKNSISGDIGNAMDELMLLGRPAPRRGVYRMLSDQAPQERTNVWDIIAKTMIGDADAYHRALTFKDDPDFRASVADTVVNALNSIEEQIRAGVPFPHFKVANPVIAAAIRGTMLDMDGQIFNNGRYKPVKGIDTFGIRVGLEKINADYPGLSMQGFQGGITVLPVKSITSPQGLVKDYYETEEALYKSNFLKADPSFLSNEKRMSLADPRVMVLPAEVQDLIPDMGSHVWTMMDAWGQSDIFSVDVDAAQKREDIVLRTVPLRDGRLRIEMGQVEVLKVWDHPDMRLDTADDPDTPALT